MFVKLIRCQVAQAERDRFSAGQAHWRALSGVGGFLGQTGGWSDDGEAVVIALWRDEISYRAFMRDVHDTIFEGNGQKGSYEKIAVSLWECLWDMPGAEPAMPLAIERACFLRFALCGVLRGRHDHFQQVQRDVWGPGMGSTAGMLAGVFCRMSIDRSKYLVCTEWASKEAHAQYHAEVFPALRDQVDFELDGASLEGLLVDVEPTWRVAL